MESEETAKPARGRPRREDRSRVAKAATFKLYQEDIDRLARLGETYGDRTRAIRLALELLESLPVEGERLASEE
jgi:hypothetical protein